MTTGKLILELAKAIERLDDGQREHYRLLSKALLSCYVNDGQRAAVSQLDSSRNPLEWKNNFALILTQEDLETLRDVFSAALPVRA